MFCEKCGTQLQDSERFCPKCGTPAPVNAVPASEGTQGAAAQPESTPQAVTNAAGNVAAGAAEAVKSAETGNQSVQSVDEGKAPKKKKGPVIAGVAAAVVLVVIIAGLSGITARIGNFVHKTFSSPEKYYQYVEKKNAQELAAAVGDFYQLYVLDQKDMFNTTANSKVSLTLGKGGKDLLELAGLAGVDLSWIESASFASDVTVKGDQLGMSFSAAVNKSNILSLVMAMDIDAGEIYLQIPELTDTYIGIDLRDAVGSSYAKNLANGWEDFQEKYTEILTSLPSQAKLEKLLNKYMKIALSCVEDVDKKSKSLKVEGVEQKCTVLEVTIDARTAADIVDAILEEAEDDGTLEDFIFDIADAFEADGDDIYDEFLDGLEYIYQGLKNVRGGDEIVLTVYVNGKGEVVGRELEAGNVTIAMLMPEKGRKFGYEFSITEGRQSFSLTGSGKRSGDKIDGDFRLRYSGVSLLDITTDNLNLKSLKKGQLNGKVEVSIGSGIGTVVGTVPGMSILQNMKFTLSGKSSAKSAECTFGLIYDGDDMGSITVSAESKKASSVKIPKEKNVIFVEDERDIEDWVDEINWDKMISNFEKADLPRSVIRALENWSDAIEDGDWDMLDGWANDLWWYSNMMRRYMRQIQWSFPSSSGMTSGTAGPWGDSNDYYDDYYDDYDDYYDDYSW